MILNIILNNADCLDDLFNNNLNKNINNVFTKVEKYLSLESLHCKNIISRESLSINCIITDDKEIRVYNNKWRNIDKATDVLSFPYDENIKGVFGDILISIETVKKNAKEYNVSIEEELIKIFIHGCLHLFGYDHIKDSDYIVMKNMEDLIFNNLDV